jgi:CubicO group peptidase (beta-lactamase class C family)
MHPRFRTVPLLLGMALALVVGSARADGQAVRRPNRLAEYEGVYAYQGNTRLTIVAGDSMLYAILDEAKYPLRSLGNDRFLNAGGDTIPFRRSTDGNVSGFVERAVFFARYTHVVDAAISAAARAVPRRGRNGGRAASYTYLAPKQLRDGISVAAITESGLDTATVTRLMNRVIDGTYPDVHGILVSRGGKLVVEEYFYEYDRARPHQMRSATKSVVSALVGIAIDQYALASDGDSVMRRLPYASYDHPDPRKNRLTLRDLLTMRSGLACDDWNAASPGNETRVYQSADWVKFVLDLPVIAAPGTHGSYCSGNVAVAGRIVERATGKALPAFAQENLFTPLGIRAADVRWNYTLSASNAATFAQLYMRPRDMLKLGILFQHDGMWQGRRVISHDWIAKSTAKWSTVGDQDYGYFWWHQWVNADAPDGPRRIEMVAASGNGGQKIFLVPTLDLVVVLTGGNYNSQSPASAIMAKELLPSILKGVHGM